MDTNRISDPRLATRPISRERFARGYRTTALLDRITTRKERHAALERLCANADRKPACLYAERSKPEFTNPPCHRLDELLLQGIDEGWLTEEALLDYFGDLCAIYLPRIAARRQADDVPFLTVAREKSEAIEAVAYDRAVRTPESAERAKHELYEDAIASIGYAKVAL